MREPSPLAQESARFSQRVYGLDIIKKAAYRLLDRFAADFRIEGDEIVCVLTFPSSTSAEAIATAVTDFQKEVLDQDLRQVVAAETSALRNAILALAFAPSKLQDRE
jgi:His-Xaa-Ser system protein HxsD